MRRLNPVYHVGYNVVTTRAARAVWSAATLIAAEGRPVTLASLVERTRMTKTPVRCAVQVLVDMGYVERLGRSHAGLQVLVPCYPQRRAA